MQEYFMAFRKYGFNPEMKFNDKDFPVDVQYLFGEQGNEDELFQDMIDSNLHQGLCRDWLTFRGEDDGEFELRDDARPAPMPRCSLISRTFRVMVARGLVFFDRALCPLIPVRQSTVSNEDDSIEDDSIGLEAGTRGRGGDDKLPWSPRWVSFS